MTQSRVPSSGAAINLSMPPAIWMSAGIFGLVVGTLVLLLNDSFSERIVWLAENYRNQAPPLLEEQIEDVTQAVSIWGWSGILAGSVSLIFSWPWVRFKISSAHSWFLQRTTHPLHLPADRYGVAFFLTAGSVLVFSGLAHWSLSAYETVDWFEGEDGVSEWWSVATYAFAAALASAAAWRLKQVGWRKLALLNCFIAGVFVLGGLEEISWGQRLFNWGTPEALSALNQQGETTIHNVGSFDSVISHFLFWASIVALVSASARAFWHRRGGVTSADFIWPSLTLSPAFLMILVWRMGDIWDPVNLPRLIMEAFNLASQGSEVPEVLLGLCICIYTYGNLRRAKALAKITES